MTARNDDDRHLSAWLHDAAAHTRARAPARRGPRADRSDAAPRSLANTRKVDPNVRDHSRLAPSPPYRARLRPIALLVIGATSVGDMLLAGGE